MTAVHPFVILATFALTLAFPLLVDVLAAARQLVGRFR